jgi:hypothetical protein
MTTTEVPGGPFPRSVELPLALLRKNAANPNEQDDRTFNATVDSIREEGWIQPMASVVPVGDYDPDLPHGWAEFEIVAGHHRYDAARVLDYETGPCWVLDPAKFDRDRQDWVMVKANILAGKLNPMKFTELYNRMARQYDAEVLQQLMGFTTEDAFRRVWKGIKTALPKELADALEKTKDEVRTIDDLSLVLNRLFREHGETLPADYMVFTWGGKEVVWIQASPELMSQVKLVLEDQARSGKPAGAVFEELLADYTPAELADAV